ncbi:hypothetical protein NUACC26_078820 [Scytonema sp. NUACC26]
MGVLARLILVAGGESSPEGGFPSAGDWRTRRANPNASASPIGDRGTPAPQEKAPQEKVEHFFIWKSLIQLLL